ncbi:TonB-dependent receptor domain-containing protein [Novosphingobium lentum]|uniref:TonB-dependent receptor domain-containing protein n=1 Tax=Novosphingobium lentum TaxID=145287 RepID=UPI000B3042B1|nr:TonB-dependent receptor [Novosphingobium lentum]
MRRIGSRLAISASLLSFSMALATPALAQNTQAPAAPDAPAEDDSAKQPVIVVTGSLIQRPNNTAVSPIVTVGEQAIKESGTSNLEDSLNQFPSFTTAGNAATGGQGTGGRALVNLHGLGTNRNLVLLDGHRLPASDVNGNVDINIIPEAIIGGVDVITGGASAVYGSDAMSGVVNFKSIRAFDGVKVDLMNTISGQGDGYKFNGSLAFGTHFADDRGHVIAAFSYAKQDPINGSTRPFFADKTPSSFIGTGTYIPGTNAPSAAAETALFAKYGIATPVAPTSVLGFNNDGSLFTRQLGGLNYKGPNGSSGYAIIGNNVSMPVGQQIDFINGLKRKTAFVKADYDLTPSLNLYGQFMYVDLTVHTASGGSLTQFPATTTIPVTNPFIPADLKTLLASRANPGAAFSWNGRYVGVPYKNWDENYIVQQYLAGVKGDITSGWTFDVFASYDESHHQQTLHSGVLKSQVQQLLNAPDGGNSLCAGGFNPFGDANARSLSAACVAFITKDANSTEKLGQTQVQAQVNGKLFDLGAGPAQIAFVADYRKNTYSFAPDADLVAPNAFNIFAPTNTAANIEAVVNTLPVSKKSITVKEAAAQIDIPLIADKPFVRELGIGGAARVSDYSTSGSVTSFEADARWRPVDSLLFRGSFQRAVRAPNIGELFSPPQGTQLVLGTPPASLGDPCDVRSNARTGANGAQVATLCQAQGVPGSLVSSYQFGTTATGQLVTGNVGLTPERANTFNMGFVFNAPRGSGILGDFTFSADYYNIKIKNVISTVPGLTSLSKCYNLDGSNPGYSAGSIYCAGVTRDPATGQLLTVATPYLNLGGLRTDGIEFQLAWSIPAPFMARSGRVYVNSAVGYTHKFKVQLFPGAQFLDYTGISNGGSQPSSVPPRATPTWKGLTTLGYRSDAFGMGLRWHYQNAMRDISAVNTPNNVAVGVAAYSLFDLFASAKVGGKFELRAGVNNLTDKALPFVASSQNGTDTALYDPIGRSFYVGVKFGF